MTTVAAVPLAQPSRRRVVVTIALCATAMGVLNALQMAAEQAYGGGPVSLPPLLVRTVTIWWMWALFAPAMIAIAKRIRTRAEHLFCREGK